MILDIKMPSETFFSFVGDERMGNRWQIWVFRIGGYGGLQWALYGVRVPWVGDCHGGCCVEGYGSF